MDFDEVLMRVSAKMVEIWLIYVCVFEKFVVTLQRNYKNKYFVISNAIRL